MTLPRRRATICSSTSRVSSVSATTLTWSMAAIFSGSARSKRPLSPRPVALISTSSTTPRGKLLRQRGSRSGLGEIGGNDGNRRAVGLELFGQGFHRLAAAGDQHEVVAVFRQFARELGADAARRAGHQSDGTRGRHHGTIPFRSGRHCRS